MYKFREFPFLDDIFMTKDIISSYFQVGLTYRGVRIVAPQF